MLEDRISNFNVRPVRKSPNVLFQELEGEAVLLNLRNGQYYGMDESSYQMYKALISSSSVQAAFETLLQVYDVEPEILKSDLDRFLSTLLENDLVIYDNEETA